MIIEYTEANEQEIKELMRKDCLRTTRRNRNKNEQKYFQYYKSTVKVLHFNLELKNGTKIIICETAGEFISKFLNRDYKSLGMTREQWASLLVEIQQTTSLSTFVDIIDEFIDNKYDTLVARSQKNPTKMRIAMNDFFNFSYFCNDFEQFFIHLLYSGLIEKDKIIKKCANCGKYFSPRFRNDARFCDNLSPQDSRRSCKDYISQHNYTEGVTSSEAAILYRKIYSRKNRRAQRHRDDKKYAEDYKTFAKLGAEWKKKIAKQQATEQEFLNWLQSVDN